MPGDIGVHSWFRLCAEWLHDLFGDSEPAPAPFDGDIMQFISMTGDHADYFTVWENEVR